VDLAALVMQTGGDQAAAECLEAVLPAIRQG
jgi:hypothetical protein